MGEKFIQGKKAQFKHKSEASFTQELASPNLLSAIADRLTRRYRFRCDRKLRHGTRVRFVSEPERQFVSVFQGNRRIGEVDAGGSADLQRIFAEHHVLANAIPAVVWAGPDIIGFYEANIRLPK